MQFSVWGVSYQETPLSLRDKASFSDTKKLEALERLTSALGVDEQARHPSDTVEPPIVEHIRTIALHTPKVPDGYVARPQRASKRTRITAVAQRLQSEEQVVVARL